MKNNGGPEILALDECPTQRDEILRQIELIERKSFPKYESLSDCIRHEAKSRSRTLLIAFVPPSHAGSNVAVAGYLLYERSAIVAHVMKLAVSEPLRRQGIGRALLTEAVKRARTPARGRTSAAARPMLALTLHVDPSREIAYALYTSIGFRETSRRIDYYCPGRHAAFMELDLHEDDTSKQS